MAVVLPPCHRSYAHAELLVSHTCLEGELSIERASSAVSRVLRITTHQALDSERVCHVLGTQQAKDRDHREADGEHALHLDEAEIALLCLQGLLIAIDALGLCLGQVADCAARLLLLALDYSDNHVESGCAEGACLRVIDGRLRTLLARLINRGL